MPAGRVLDWAPSGSVAHRITERMFYKPILFGAARRARTKLARYSNTRRAVGQIFACGIMFYYYAMYQTHGTQVTAAIAGYWEKMEAKY
jgi:hypothetical protein